MAWTIVPTADRADSTACPDDSWSPVRVAQSAVTQHFHVVRSQDRGGAARLGVGPSARFTRLSRVKATIDNNAIAGSSRAVVVNCMSSIWQPVFFAL